MERTSDETKTIKLATQIFRVAAGNPFACDKLG